MERLTHRETPENTAYVDRGLVSLNWYSMTDEGYRGPAIDRLAAYEDTGLEPEEVRALAVAEKERKSRLEHMQVYQTLDGVPVGMVLPKIDMECENAQMSADTSARMAAIKDIPLQRLIEFAQAEKDGRLVVLPKEKEVTDEEITELTGYKCPICKHHHLCTMPGMRAMCGESYTHFEPRKPQEAEEALREEGDRVDH